jgi:hypothetical protein
MRIYAGALGEGSLSAGGLSSAVAQARAAPVANSNFHQRTQKLSDSRKCSVHVNGTGDEVEQQVRPVLFENGRVAFHAHIGDYQMDWPGVSPCRIEHMFPIISFKNMKAVTP